MTHLTTHHRRDGDDDDTKKAPKNPPADPGNYDTDPDITTRIGEHHSTEGEER